MFNYIYLYTIIHCSGKLFKILKGDAVKVLQSISQQIWKTQQWSQDWNGSVFIPIPKKSNSKECSNYCTIVLILHASKVMLKILQARLQQYVNRELPGVQAGFRKGRGTRDQIANNRWQKQSQKKEEFQKNIYLWFIDYAKAIDCVHHNKLWKILKDMGILASYLLPEKPVCSSESNNKNWTWNNRLVPYRKRSMSTLYIVTLLI